MKSFAWSSALAASALAVFVGARDAAADPIALRSGNMDRAVHFAIGAPESSIGVWFRPHLGVALEWRAPVALGASVATRFTIAGRPRGVGLDATGAVGLQFLRYDPGAALTATLALQLRYRSDRVWFSFGVASPMSLQIVGDFEARLPVLAELGLMVNIGRAWLGAQGGSGLVFVPGLSPSLAWQGTFLFTVPWDS